LTKIFLSSITEVSQSSKHFAFFSLHIHHIKPKWDILQISKTEQLPTWPLQHCNNSVNFPSMTHSTSKRLMSNIHNSLAMSQWRKKISIDFLLLLHMLHQYTTMTFLVLRLSTVKIFPRASVQTKKLMLDGTLTFQIVFHGNEELVGVDKFW
jgi:hypothetical protein